VRAPTGGETIKAIDKVLNCLKAGALSSGCSYEISREHMYMDMQQSEAFTDYFTQVTEGRWGKDEYPVDRTPITAGTDLVCNTLFIISARSVLINRVMYPITCHRYTPYSTSLKPKLVTFHVSS
jgi:hypothetical protein